MNPCKHVLTGFRNPRGPVPTTAPPAALFNVAGLRMLGTRHLPCRRSRQSRKHSRTLCENQSKDDPKASRCHLLPFGPRGSMVSGMH